MGISTIELNPIILVVLEILGAIICAFMFFIKILDKDKKDTKINTFLVIVFLTIFSILFDELYLVFGGIKDFSNFISYILLVRYILICVIFVLFGEYIFYGLNKKILVPRIIEFSILVLFLVGLIVNKFNGFLYTFEDGTFTEGKYFVYLNFTYDLIIAIQAFSFIYLSIKFDRKIIGYILVQIPIIVCLGIDYLISDYTFMFVGISISCAISYGLIIKEQNELFKKQQDELYNANVALMLSQMQPHFLYNTLSAIGEICLEDPKKASKAIDNFSFYLRANLESIGANKMISFDEELKHIKYYISLEQIRLEDRLTIEFNIKDSDFLVPTLCVQPIVENAIKHGLFKIREGGKLKLSSFRKDGYVNIIVEDNGVGFNPKGIDTKKHVGLDNVKKRIKSLVDGDVIVDSVIGKGSKVTIRFRG